MHVSMHIKILHLNVLLVRMHSVHVKLTISIQALVSGSESNAMKCNVVGKTPNVGSCLVHCKVDAISA